MTYTPCAGTGQRATGARVMRPTDAKYRHLFGKVTASCPECGRSVRVPSVHSPITPAHKPAA